MEYGIFRKSDEYFVTHFVYYIYTIFFQFSVFLSALWEALWEALIIPYYIFICQILSKNWKCKIMKFFLIRYYYYLIRVIFSYSPKIPKVQYRKYSNTESSNTESSNTGEIRNRGTKVRNKSQEQKSVKNTQK